MQSRGVSGPSAEPSKSKTRGARRLREHHARNVSRLVPPPSAPKKRRSSRQRRNSTSKRREKKKLRLSPLQRSRSLRRKLR